MHPSDPSLTTAEWEHDCEWALEHLSYYIGEEYRGSTLYMVLEDTATDGWITTDTWYDLEKST